MTEKLIWRDLKVRAVQVPLRRPVISKVGVFEKLPLILLDLETEQGIVGRSYLIPFLRAAVRCIIPAIRDLAEARKGTPVAPFDVYERGRKALGLVGLEGVSLIAVSGVDVRRLGTPWRRRPACRSPSISAAVWGRCPPITVVDCGWVRSTA